MTMREEMHSLAQDIIRSCEDRASGIAQLRLDVSAMLKGVGDAHAAMARELKADLARQTIALKEAEGERQQTATQEMAQRRSDVGALRSDVGALLHGFHTELAGARDEWHNLTATLSPKRSGTPTPQTAGLDKKVFDYLANHPNGTRMTELEQEFGMPRIQMARVLRSLMDEKKAKKQQLLYIAT